MRDSELNFACCVESLVVKPVYNDISLFIQGVCVFVVDFFWRSAMEYKHHENSIRLLVMCKTFRFRCGVGAVETQPFRRVFLCERSGVVLGAFLFLLLWLEGMIACGSGIKLELHELVG